MIIPTSFGIKDKKRIYELIDFFLTEKIDAWTFCDEFHICYGLNLDLDSLTESEANTFNELSQVTGRFSKFKEDHKNYPGTYFTEEELKNKILEIKQKLGLQNS